MNNQATLKWQVPSNINSSKEMNGFFRGYRVEWCPGDLASVEACSDRRQYQDFIENVPNHPLSMTYGRRRRRSADSVEQALHRWRRATSNVQFTITRLPGNAALKAWVRVINKRYAGPPSNVITFKTSIGVPGPASAFTLKVGVS